MRVTNQMMTNHVIKSTNDAKEMYFNSIRKINSGRRVERPADDAPAAEQSINFTRMLKKIKTLEHSTRIVSIDLQAAEVAVRQGTELISEATALTLQMANDAYNASDRESAAKRITQIREELLHIVNQKQAGGRYLFGGISDQTPAYDPITGAYQGNTDNRRVEIAPDLFVDATVSGTEGFGDPEQVFTDLEDLAGFLENNDLGGIQDSIDSLNVVMDTLTVAQADIGSRIQVLQDADILNEDLYVETQIRKSVLIDTDLASEVTRMKAGETALAASLEVGKNFLQFSMFNWR
jgi:flagellar hook-associated protein 3 FlgL